MQCPMCLVEMKLIPAGVSKSTGKKYGSFYSCPECKQTLNAEVKVEQGIQPVFPKKSVSNGDDKAKTMVLSYAKDLVIAMSVAGIAPPDFADATIGIYRKLMAEIEK